MDKDERPDPVVPRTIALRQSMWRAIEAIRDREGKVSMVETIRELLKTALVERPRQ